MKKNTKNNVTKISKAIRHSLIFSALVLPYLVTSTLVQANNNVAIEQQVNIATGDLGKQLSRFAADKKVVIYFDASLTKGLKAKAFQGKYSIDAALTTLLSGTGLSYSKQADGAYAIKKSSKITGTLALTIVDSTSNSITEGTGSYTISSMSTATKLNLSLRETPQSIVVVTNQELKDKNIQDFRSLTDSVVGFNSPVWDSDRIFISARGFSIDYYQIDGVPTTYNGFQTEQNLVLFDRVEIVKGANGLTTGAGNPAASINMVRKHANSKDFQGDATLRAGSWDTYSATADVSFPLTEDGSVRSRIVVQKENKGSFRDLYAKQSNIIYAVIDADLNSQTLVSFGASYMDSNTEGSTWSGAPVFFSDGSLTNFESSVSFNPSWASYDKSTTSAFANFEHRFLNDIKINANVTYNKTEADPKTTAFVGYPDKTTGLGLSSPWGVWNSQYETVSKALDLYATIPLEFANNQHELIIGATFNKQDDQVFGQEEEYKNLNAQSVYDWDGNIAEPTYADPVLSYEETVEQIGFYAVGRFNLTDDLKLITGARLSNYEYQCHYDSWGCYDNYENENVITPYAGLVYDFNENHSAYISYTNIFKTQNYKDINSDVIDPKEGNSYEIGIKGQYFNNRVDAGITLFKITLDNVAEQSGQIIAGSGDSAYITVDGVTSEGVEIMVKGEITENWNIDFGLSSLSLKDEEGQDRSTTTPRNEVAISTKYKLGQFSFGGGASWQDKFYTDVQNPSDDSIQVNQGSVFLVNAMAKYEFNDELGLQLNISNLFDKVYYSNVVYGYYGGGFIFGDPRNVTLALNYNF